jgi:hypothetical protein
MEKYKAKPTAHNRTVFLLPRLIIDFCLPLQRKIYKRNMMIRNIKAVERTAFPQQVKTVKAVHTAGTLCAIPAKIFGKILDKKT